jgi:hypothetical protein
VSSARANQALASWRTNDVLNVRPIAISQPEIFQQILHVAIWAFNVQTSFKHADQSLPSPVACWSSSVNRPSHVVAYPCRENLSHKSLSTGLLCFGHNFRVARDPGVIPRGARPTRQTTARSLLARRQWEVETGIECSSLSRQKRGPRSLCFVSGGYGKRRNPPKQSPPRKSFFSRHGCADSRRGLSGVRAQLLSGRVVQGSAAQPNRSINQRQRLRVLGEDRGKHAWDNVTIIPHVATQRSRTGKSSHGY